MKDVLPPAQEAAKPLALTDILSTAIGVCLRRPFVLLIPLLLDLWLVWGMPITPQPLVRYLSHATNFQEWEGVNPQQIEALWKAAAGLDMRQEGVFLQLFPSLGQATQLPSQSNAVVIFPDGWGLGGVFLGLNGLVFCASVVMLLPLAQVVGKWPTPIAWMQLGGRTLWNLIRLLGLMVGIMLLLAVPLTVAGLTLVLRSAWALQLFVAGLSIGLVIVWVMLSFAIEAVLVGQVGPLTAVYQSYAIVRNNVRATAMLVVVLWTLQGGYGYLMQPLLKQPLGIIGASAVYALISGVIVAARMVFYRDRVLRLERTMPRVFAKK